MDEQSDIGAGTDDLRACSKKLLLAPDKLAWRLDMVDKYIQTFSADPQKFILAKEHDNLKPLIEAFADDRRGFLRYIINMRDSFSTDSAVWRDVQRVYRVVLGRDTQQRRRDRAARALAKAVEAYGPAPLHTRLHWVARIERDWGKRRLAFLAEIREGLARTTGTEVKKTHIPADELPKHLEDFWAAIDAEIENEKVPPWN